MNHRRGGSRGGISVLIVGPDGAGKSTLAQGLIDNLCPEVDAVLHVHWRPGLLPHPGALLRRADPGPDPQPHERPLHGSTLSLALLGYHWLDFFLGGWFRLQRARARGGLVVVERGWWDLAVDARRYRMRVGPALVRALGALLPRPDLALVLEGEPTLLSARKNELTAAEVERQTARWRELPVGARSVVVDASAPAEVVLREAESIVRESLVRQRAGRREWTTLPGNQRASASYPAFDSGPEPRWWLPRAQRDAVRQSLLLYHPVTAKGRLAWEATRLLAVGGGFSLLRPCSPPPDALYDALETTVRDALDRSALAGRIDLGSFSAVKCNRYGRFVLLLRTIEGTPGVVAKVALEDEGKLGLAREAANLERFGRLVPLPLTAPSLVGTGDGVLLLVPVPWRHRLRPGRLDEEVAVALGRFFGRGTSRNRSPLGLAHGDASPWNLLRTATGWALLDWEHASDSAPPFHDLFHFLVHAHSLMGRPARAEILAGLQDRGWVGGVIAAYARGAGLSRRSAPRYLASYLEASLDPDSELVDNVTEDGRCALAARRHLLAEIGT